MPHALLDEAGGEEPDENLETEPDAVSVQQPKQTLNALAVAK
jgi:hypothetical protein